MNHECQRFKEAEAGMYGSAITEITLVNEEWDGKQRVEVSPYWMMDNDEYATYPIFYCPFCGIKLEDE